MKKVVVLTGAGMSAESGLPTFRDMGGIWEKYDVTQVASPQAWAKNPELVLRFYNERRKKLFESSPNEGHHLLARLENYYDVHIVTQNVDDLHEQAGSKNVLHLHGELRKVRSTTNPDLIYELKHWELSLGDCCQEGSQLRPHIVWFGEAVEAFDEAMEIVSGADVFLVVGTSLNVYPAAGLISFVPATAPVYVIDPGQPSLMIDREIEIIREKASVGLKMVYDKLKNAESF